jgi:hypothetical protein
VTSALRLTTAEVDERIEAVRAMLDRTTARLVELDADVTRRLLETASELQGATAAAWADGARRHQALWEGQLALERLLERMARERGARRSAPQWVLVRLDALLQGAFVELPRPGESGLPRLTEQTSPTVSCSVAEAFDRMSTDFDVVTQLLGAVAEAWGETTERLHHVGAVLAALDRGSEAAGHRRPNDLAPLTRAVRDAEATVRHDPLALDPDRVAQLEVRAQRLRDTAEEADRERRAESKKLVAAEQSIGAGLESLIACRVQVDAWSQKIVVPDSTVQGLDVLERDLERLDQECARARSLGIGASAEDLRHRSDRLRDEVTRLAASESTRMARRDELRGLLAAYRAKALALELAENTEIETLSQAAERALYVAPCDVDAAEGCVRELQQAILRLQKARP